ncbi:MAG TPA: hypothetical protein DCS93_12905 [Microscillaceae bacterium]|nr:hypothetical protein [Microscillaceae bacterium]
MNWINLALIALTLGTWQTSKAQQVIDFQSSRCDYNNSRLYFHKKMRITSLERSNDYLKVAFNAKANCTVKYKVAATVDHGTLHLKFVPIPVSEVTLFDGTKEYHYGESMCNCWFTFTVVVQLPSPQNIQNFTANSYPLKQCFTPRFKVARAIRCRGIYQPTPKLLPDVYVVAKGDTINKIDQYGARQGIHWKPGRMFFKFKDDKLQKMWWVRNDRFVEEVHFYKNGKITKKKAFD